MRLLLDAHVSGRAVAAALRERGHEVRAVDEERALDGCDDSSVLELASREQRIVVTCDVKDFARLVSERVAGGGHHAGCLLLAGIDHSEYGLIIRLIDAALAARPDQAAWRDYAAWATPAGGA